MENTVLLNQDQDLILIDWLTVTSKCDSVQSMIELLGMTDPGIIWETKEAYMNGYPMRCHFNGINILSGGTAEMGICLTMSGSGCRAFESYGHGNWWWLLEHFSNDLGSYNYTRLDLAFDDHTGILDMDVLRDDTDDHYYRSRSRWWKVEYGSQGCTIYHGSPQSEIRIRIYDKAAERGCQNSEHWVRVEIMMRRDNAARCVAMILERQRIGVVFCGVLRNYLCYLEPSSDSNRSRWELAPYWDKLLNGAAPLSTWAAPGEEYNIFRLENWLVHQCGGGIKCWAEIYGLDDLDNKIKMAEVRVSPKHQRLINEHERLKAMNKRKSPGNPGDEYLKKGEST